jgi:hypothetical protein
MVGIEGVGPMGLASMIHFGRANPGTSLEDLIASSQQGVAEFAREAMKRFKANESG